MIRKRVLL